MIEIEQRPDSSVVCRPSGELDLASSIQLRHVLSELFQPYLKLVIDLDRVDRIDAVGASVLLGLVRRVSAHGGTVRVINVRPYVRWFFELVGVEGVIPFVDAAPSPDAA